ncbi:hypothetical protein ADICYQ_5250 [Cyclobacterium qasimii M12-11B]|uniref:Uncharacterized protein n=1 Tax=Cyclobacterium qasimii M12-11B TaxID=641524 RepID=S7V865_9BACT|nr:hypothetical protein ADICYQ_5250 [Cyclobacterium qasimii M12-11B]
MEAGQTAEIAFIHEVKNGPQLSQPVFHRRAAQRDMVKPLQLPDCA